MMAREIDDISDLNHELLEVVEVTPTQIRFRVVGRDSGYLLLRATGDQFEIEQLQPLESGPSLRDSALPPLGG